MTDFAYALLEQQANTLSGKVLWIVDESYDGSSHSFFHLPELIALTNRIDVADTIKGHGVNCTLNDFDFSVFENHYFDAVVFRIAKEKAIVHHVINSLPSLLNTDGQAWLLGGKGEGIKTYVDKAKRYLNCETYVDRGKKTMQLVKLAGFKHVAERLDDKSYPDLRALASIGGVYSKPGVFGWNKVDQGSELLVEALPKLLSDQNHSINHVIDLGCGYGFISVACHRLSSVEITATDNNMAAVAACQKNFATNKMAGEVVLADCGLGITKKADLVVCNPPFHMGFDHDKQLTDHFVKRASELLEADGQALFVVNSFIGLEKIAQAYFSEVDLLENDKQFKLVLLKK